MPSAGVRHPHPPCARAVGRPRPRPPPGFHRLAPRPSPSPPPSPSRGTWSGSRSASAGSCACLLRAVCPWAAGRRLRARAPGRPGTTGPRPACARPCVCVCARASCARAPQSVRCECVRGAAVACPPRSFNAGAGASCPRTAVTFQPLPGPPAPGAVPVTNPAPLAALAPGEPWRPQAWCSLGSHLLLTPRLHPAP